MRSESIHIRDMSKWGEMVEQAANSQGTQQHLYITSGIAKVSANKEEAASLELIASCSESIISANRDDLIRIGESKDLSPEVKLEMKNAILAENKKIFENTERLIDAKATTREKNIFLKAARIISFLSSFFLIGVPFFIAIRNEDEKFKKEVEDLKFKLRGTSREVVEFKKEALQTFSRSQYL